MLVIASGSDFGGSPEVLAIECSDSAIDDFISARRALLLSSSNARSLSIVRARDGDCGMASLRFVVRSVWMDDG
jgi:hypothetical protein